MHVRPPTDKRQVGNAPTAPSSARSVNRRKRRRADAGFQGHIGRVPARDTAYRHRESADRLPAIQSSRRSAPSVRPMPNPVPLAGEGDAQRVARRPASRSPSMRRRAAVLWPRSGANSTMTSSAPARRAGPSMAAVSAAGLAAKAAFSNAPFEAIPRQASRPCGRRQFRLRQPGGGPRGTWPSHRQVQRVGRQPGPPAGWAIPPGSLFSSSTPIRLDRAVEPLCQIGAEARGVETISPMWEVSAIHPATRFDRLTKYSGAPACRQHQHPLRPVRNTKWVSHDTAAGTGKIVIEQHGIEPGGRPWPRTELLDPGIEHGGGGLPPSSQAQQAAPHAATDSKLRAASVLKVS